MRLRISPVMGFLFGLCSVLFTGVAATAAEFTGEAKVLAQQDDAWSASSGKRDVDLLVSFYADDAVAYPPGAAAASNRADIRAVWAGIADPNYSLAWTATHAEVSKGGELGFTSGTFVEKITANGKTTTATGKFLCVWRKQADGKWKAIHDMWNYDK